MEEDDTYRRRTLELLTEKCGSSFKEEDLSPSICKEIGFLSYRLIEMNNFFLDSGIKNKIGRDKRISSYALYLIGATFFIFGVLYQSGSIILNLALIVGSAFLIQIGYLLHLSRKHDLEKFASDSLESSKNTWNTDLKNLSDKISDELSKSHDISETKMVQCPKCGKDMPNDSPYCSYCAMTLLSSLSHKSP